MPVVTAVAKGRGHVCNVEREHGPSWCRPSESTLRPGGSRSRHARPEPERCSLRIGVVLPGVRAPALSVTRSVVCAGADRVKT